MEYDVIMMSREHHKQHVDSLTQSYAAAQADSKSLQILLSNGIERISSFVETIGSQSRQSSPNSYESGSQFAPVVLDDRRGDSW